MTPLRDVQSAPDDGAVETLMGWCQTHGRPDQYHGLCRIEYRTPLGVLTRCSCPNHQEGQ